MANHLEQLTSEWLGYNGYFVRQSVLVGKLDKGGFAGELDIVAFNPKSSHLLHVECSLDADNWEKRESRFSAKFERGRTHVPALFNGFELPAVIDQVALLQMGGGARTSVGGARIVWVADFVAHIMQVLRAFHPNRAAVPSTLPLLRTLQHAAHFSTARTQNAKLIPE